MIRLHWFARPRDLTANLICLVTGSRYYHVAIEVDDRLWESTRVGHRAVPLAEYGRSSDLTIVVPLPADRHADVVEALDARLTDRYGYLDCLFSGARSLLGATWGRLTITDTTASHCAHYAGVGLQHGGVDLPCDPNCLTPGDLAQHYGGETPCRGLRQRLRRAFAARD